MGIWRHGSGSAFESTGLEERRYPEAIRKRNIDDITQAVHLVLARI